MHKKQQQNYHVGLITQEDISVLVKYIPYFESDSKFGEYAKIENGSIGCSVLSEKADGFLHACYGHHFVQPFDWPQWVEENRDLVHEGKGIESLNLEEIGKLITAHCRGDRFCDGHLLSIMNNGELLSILNRLNQIASSGK